MAALSRSSSTHGRIATPLSMENAINAFYGENTPGYAGDRKLLTWASMVRLRLQMLSGVVDARR